MIKAISDAAAQITFRCIYVAAISGALFGLVSAHILIGTLLQETISSTIVLLVGIYFGLILGILAGLADGVGSGIVVGFLLHSVYRSSHRQMNYWVISTLSSLVSFLLVLAILGEGTLWFSIALAPALIAGVANAYNGWRYARSVVDDTLTQQPA